MSSLAIRTSLGGMGLEILVLEWSFEYNIVQSSAGLSSRVQYIRLIAIFVLLLHVFKLPTLERLPNRILGHTHAFHTVEQDK